MSQAVSDYGIEYFSISMINTKFLKMNDIKMSVKDFKIFIKTQPNEIAITGGCFHIKHVKIWNINIIKDNLPKKKIKKGI